MDRITIDHEIFEPMREDFNSAISRLISVMNRTKSTEGSLSCRITAELVPVNYTDPNSGEFKDVMIPQFNHKIKIAVKHDAQISGSSCGEYEIMFSNDEIRIGEYSNGQLNMFNGGLPK